MSNLTCKALAAAAVSLLEERPLDKITVRDITDRCGLTRNTFYYHFQDIYDLLGYIFREEADATLEKYSVKGDWKEVFLDILSYLKMKKRMIEHVYYSTRKEELEFYVQQVVGVYALQFIEIETAGSQQTGQGNGCRFLSECVCRSHLSVDQGWHEGYADGHGGII